MGDTNRRLTAAETKGLRTAKELEGHLAWLDTFTPAALGVLAIASGVYTYLGVTSLLEDTGAMSFFAAVAYSVAVSVGIFVFWSYMLRLLPSMRTAGGFIGLTVSTMVGSLAIIAMSSWLNAAALAGSAAVEQHLAQTVQEYQDRAGVDEGMNGISTRFAFKVLSSTFNFDTDEVAADPVHLMYVLEQMIKREQFPAETEAKYLAFIKTELAPRYEEFIGNEIQKAYLESYTEYGQNVFDRYIAYADAWIEEQDYKDPDTGQLYDREVLDAELSKIEKPVGIANPKDFRNEVVKFALRHRANTGANPAWNSYEKLRDVIEKHMFSQVEELLPVISFGSKKDSKTEGKHQEFVERMRSHGYTDRQVRRLVEWYMRVNKAG